MRFFLKLNSVQNLDISKMMLIAYFRLFQHLSHYFIFNYNGHLRTLRYLLFNCTDRVLLIDKVGFLFVNVLKGSGGGRRKNIICSNSHVGLNSFNYTHGNDPSYIFGVFRIETYIYYERSNEINRMNPIRPLKLCIA